MTDLQHREQALTALLEEDACRRLISRYSAAIDWADKKSLAGIFWPDAQFDFGAAFFVGSGTAGLDFLIDSVNASLCRTHALGSTWLKVDNGEARAETSGWLHYPLFLYRQVPVGAPQTPRGVACFLVENTHHDCAMHTVRFGGAAAGIPITGRSRRCSPSVSWRSFLGVVSVYASNP